MKAVIQRVAHCSVRVDNQPVGEIGLGILVLLGVGQEDSSEDIPKLFDKIVNLRIFPNDEGKFDRSLLDVGGQILIVSQFTLFGDCRKGRRPNFSAASPPNQAEKLYLESIHYCQNLGIATQSGQFGAMMQVELTNDGPVTLILDTETL